MHVPHKLSMFPTHGACIPHKGMFLTHCPCFPHTGYVSQTQSMFPTHEACFTYMGHVSHTHGMFLQTSLKFFPQSSLLKIFKSSLLKFSKSSLLSFSKSSLLNVSKIVCCHHFLKLIHATIALFLSLTKQVLNLTAGAWYPDKLITSKIIEYAQFMGNILNLW